MIAGQTCIHQISNRYRTLSFQRRPSSSRPSGIACTAYQQPNVARESVPAESSAVGWEGSREQKVVLRDAMGSSSSYRYLYAAYAIAVLTVASYVNDLVQMPYMVSQALRCSASARFEWKLRSSSRCSIGTGRDLSCSSSEKVLQG